LLESAALEFEQSPDKPISREKWVEGLNLTGGQFNWTDHEFQREILTSDHRQICMRKGTQIGGTAAFILKIIYNLIFGIYTQAAMVIMPTVDSVVAYSKSRFSPLIEDNEKIKRLVSSTDSATLKKVRKSFLYFVGGQLTSSLDRGLKKSSTALKSSPCDAILVDEVDEISSKAIDLAKERLSHSRIKHEFYLSTPSLPNFGIDKLYQEESDQRIWMIRCSHCGHETCLEQEFPSCLIERPNGSVYRACKHCKSEIHPKDGRWVPQYPGKDMRGYWISQLNSAFVSPKEILKAHNEKENIQEFYNSKLGLPYVASENQLSASDIFSNCGKDLMATSHTGPSCAGLDIGKMLHLTVAVRVKEKVFQVVYMARVSTFADVSDICKRFHTKCLVADIEPETRAVREWQQSENFEIFLCDYIGSALNGPGWDEQKQTLRINRTEAIDAVHEAITNPGRIIFPRRCDEFDEFAKELQASAKVLEENELGGRRFVWKKLGPDHYLHSLAYCLLAGQRIQVCESLQDAMKRRMLEVMGAKNREYNALTFGLTDDGYDGLRFGDE
jgi:hypothetical protein